MAITVFPRHHDSVAGATYGAAIHAGHPCARSLIAAFVAADASTNIANTFHDQRIIDRVRGMDCLATFNAGVTVGGYSATGRTIGRLTSGNSGGGTSASSILQRSVPVSQFWYGCFTADPSSAGYDVICGITHSNSNAAPYLGYNIARYPTAADLSFGANTGGSLSWSTASSVISSADYFRPIALGQTLSDAGNYGYKDGRQILAAAAITGIGYGASPLLSLGCNTMDGFTPTTNVAMALWLIFAAALTPTEHLMLALDPFGIFVAPQVS